jgi:hypothetical protein
MLRSDDARVRRAAFTLLEASNPTLRRDGELFMEIVQFIWNANASYDVYREFSERHLFVRRYKVHELILARLKQEKLKQKSARNAHHAPDKHGYAPRYFERVVSLLSSTWRRYARVR